MADLLRTASLLTLALIWCGCPTAEPEPEPEPYVPAWPTLTCDDIAAAHCAFPFPNNVFTRADATTDTGLRLALSVDAMPSTTAGPIDPADWNVADGFSPGGPLLVHIPGARADELVGSHAIGASLEGEARTILLNTATGALVPHWAELDRTLDDDDTRALLIHPAARLDDATRYVVGVRGLTNSLGQPLQPAPAFAALLGGDGPADRQDHYTRDLLPRLAEAGWGTDDLLVAWDFTTASRRDTTQWLLHMRDEAMAEAADGQEFTIDVVEDDWNPDTIAFRLQGTLTAPLYLTEPGPGGRLLFGDDGLPEVNAATPTMEVPFTVLIPQSATAGAKPLLQYGHGLFGAKEQVHSGHFRSFIDTYGWVFFAADLKGMASDDEQWVRDTLLGGDLGAIAAMYDRLHQGFLNWILLMELMTQGMADDATWGPYIDASVARYHGISQGGIMGLAYAGMSPHIDRAALGVMGQPYALLLNRSVDFEEFFLALQLALGDARDIQLVLALVQMMWNRVEPQGWSAYIDDPDPGGRATQVFMRAAIGDHQVPTLGAHAMARTLGAAHVDTGLRDLWGLDLVGSAQGSHAYVEYDFGLPDVPPCNVPMSLCDDPHGKLRSLDEAREQLDAFLRTGAVTNTCAGGVCSFPALSGCVDGEDDAASQALCE